MPADCLIRAGTVLCGTGQDGRMRVLEDAAIRVENGIIAEIGPLDTAPGALPAHGSAETIALPGLVNSHHHFGLTPLMMGVPFAPLELWLPQFRSMRQVGPRLDTLYSAIEMLESGTTCVHHIHSGLTGRPEDWEAETAATLGAYAETGMRAGFSFMMRDQNLLAYEDDAEVLATLPGPLRDWLAPSLAPAAVPTSEYMDFFRAARAQWAEARPGHVRLNLAPANLHWCSDEALQLISRTARDTGAQIHMHLVETERQAAYARRRFGTTAVRHLHDLGLLGPELTLGHGNWTTPEDLDLLADCGCSVCHNASSGLRLGSGVAPVNEMRRRGIPVALGIDQSNLADDRDMTLEMKLVWALHRETGLWNDRPDAAAVLRMATEHGARTAGFPELGRIEPGRPADIVLMDAARIGRPLIDDRTPVEEAVLHRGGKQTIEKVFVGGELVVEGGRCISVDRDAVMAEIAARLSRPLSPEEREARRMVAALMPHLEAFHRAHTPDGYRPYRVNALDPRG